MLLYGMKFAYPIYIEQEQKMVALTKKEILDELRKLGIESPAELRAFLKEYKAYYCLLSTDNFMDRSQKQACLQRLVSFLKRKKDSVIP